MTFVQAIEHVLKNYANFRGRAGRAEFWWWTLAVFIIAAITGIADGALVAPVLGLEVLSRTADAPVTYLLQLALLCPNLAVCFRRLHDRGRTAWWMLLAFIPLIGTIILIIMFAGRGDEFDNRFGPPPPR